MGFTVLVRDANGNTLRKVDLDNLEPERVSGVEARRFDNGEGVVVTLFLEEGED